MLTLNHIHDYVATVDPSNVFLTQDPNSSVEYGTLVNKLRLSPMYLQVGSDGYKYGNDSKVTPYSVGVNRLLTSLSYKSKVQATEVKRICQMLINEGDI